MDSLRLLSRSAKSTKKSKKNTTPSSGQHSQPQSVPIVDSRETTSKKRKRGLDVATLPDDRSDGLDFFAKRADTKVVVRAPPADDVAPNSKVSKDGTEAQDVGNVPDSSFVATNASSDEVRAILKQHKLKVTWLNPGSPQKKAKRKGKEGNVTKTEKPQLYPQPLRSFRELGDRYAVQGRVAANVLDQGYTTPTEVQLAALPLLLESPSRYLGSTPENVNSPSHSSDGVDLLTVAPTGSGKTLAFMIPLLHRIGLERRRNESMAQTTAIVLAPTKELASQIANEGRKLADGTKLRVTQLRKGMRLTSAGPQKGSEDAAQPAVKADIIVGTPGLLHNMLEDEDELKQTSLKGVRHLVLDEADVLLDPLFREQTLSVWRSLSNPSLRVSLWSATMGSNIEELACSTIHERQHPLRVEGGDVQAAPIIRLVVGLKDSAVSNVEHRLVYAATEQGKLMGLRHLLHPAATPRDTGPPLLPPFLVFTQTIERAIALHSELLYDIPAEAGGISRIAVLHSDLSDTARDSVMTRFRKGEIWVLITTDLLSRGVDFRGVNGVVNYDIPTSSAAYVHRVGRTGRAGREGGVAVTLYSKEDIPYLKHVANVVAMAQKQKGTGSGEGMQQWLLDALPTLSKPEKQKLKKRGIESRTTRGKDADTKAARRSRISSKAGFVRKSENNRRGAIVGNQRRQQADLAGDAGDETDFGGFD